jgi:hypothetical protein
MLMFIIMLIVTKRRPGRTWIYGFVGLLSLRAVTSLVRCYFRLAGPNRVSHYEPCLIICADCVQRGTSWHSACALSWAPAFSLLQLEVSVLPDFFQRPVNPSQSHATIRVSRSLASLAEAK